MFSSDRRAVMIGAISVLAVACAPRSASQTKETARPAAARSDLAAKLQALEERAGGRLGAFILDTADGSGAGWRENERFAHCSSFKLSLAAMFLAEADRGEIDLAERLRWTEADMLPTSNTTRAHIETGMTIEELARTTLVQSDNTAANVLLRRAGGPAQLTAFWRSIGDNVSRLDRYETELNEVPPGTELDTTTPAAMAQTVARLVDGDALQPASRAKIRAWMAEVQTGTRRLRAGLPEGWAVGDNTGTGLGERSHTYVDVGYAGPAGRKPLVVAAYFNPSRLTDGVSPEAEAVLAEVARIAVAGMAGSGSGHASAFVDEPAKQALKTWPALL